jgi:hypothetical protein
MGKKKNNTDDIVEDIGDDVYEVHELPDETIPPARPAPQAPSSPRPKMLPSLSVGDILALLTLIVLSAALLLEGYHKEFKDYSKEIIALFAVVVGFLLGRKN